ncbi:hypothetical protein ACJMK2_007245 [Sinanodonta woodiana]|uniref:Basement membrane-specific heparan sulfate proteoglycan core protein n=1 Tax=Sinanodonta woodiana TaxID=1069815 RepID=A0ABD3VHY0_SINWO
MAFKMKENSRTLLVLFIIFFGLVICSTAEKDFEFTDSFKDDEDFSKDEGSGSGNESITVPYLDRSDLFRATVNFSELLYTPEIANAGRDFMNILIIREIQAAINKLLLTLPGQIQVRIVELRQGSLIVTFDIQTDGTVTNQQVRQLIEEALANGQIGQFRVSPAGFNFRAIRDDFKCSPFVGRKPELFPGAGENGANLMINNAFPCDGFVRGWTYYRIKPSGVAYAGIFRHVSETEWMLVDKTELPAGGVGVQNVTVVIPILARAGDFIGVFYPNTTRENVVSKVTQQDNVLLPAELYQTYYINMFDADLKKEVPFSVNSFVHSITNAVFGIQAVMDYVNVPVVTPAPPAVCTADQYKCVSGECVDGRYRCDGQHDCYDGSDEENCPTVVCLSDEFQCVNQRECVSLSFRCNGILECEDGSDEAECEPSVSCGPGQFRCFDGTCIDERLRCDSRADCSGGFDEFNCQSIPCEPGQFRCERGQCIMGNQRCNGQIDCPDGTDELDCPSHIVPVTILSFRDGSESTSFSLLWRASQPTGIQIIGYRVQYSEVSVRPDRTPDGNYQVDTTIGPYRVVKLPSGADRFTIVDLKPGRYYEAVVFATDSSNQLSRKSFIFKTADAPVCSVSEFQCKSGTCIDLARKCDGFPDCPDDSDEVAECFNTTKVCSEGQMVCKDRLGSVRCISPQEWNSSICISECRQDEFQCHNGQCISAGQRCDRQSQCTDGSDEINCTCPVNNFQCRQTNILECIDNKLHCDGTPDCTDGSDEEGCSCAQGFFRCNDGNCVPDRLRCDGIPQCEDGSDEIQCACPASDFQCANLQCIDLPMRCDGFPDCVDRSDEIGCQPVVRCRGDQFQCADGNCVEARMKCDGTPQCEDGSDEQNCPNCPPDNFQCETTSKLECVDNSLVCDGFPDCTDKSDEAGCPSCRTDQFTCTNGNCVEGNMRCDGRAQCEDGSDEIGCPFRCAVGEFKCAGVDDCVAESFRCDGTFDCSDRSDEFNCTCRENQFQCGDGICIDGRRRCDGTVDCVDKSDELACPCRSGQFQCQNGDCIPEGFKCNGRAECEDGSDEENCACKETELRCNSGECIDLRRRCDRVPDCRDGSDETNCPTEPPKSVDIEPKQLEISEGEKVMLVCSYSGFPPGARFDWRRVGQSLPVGTTIDRRGNTLIIPEAKAEDSGDYVCTVDNYQASTRVVVTRRIACAAGEFQCKSDRTCIDARRFCNGFKECADGSDEMGCPTLPPKSVDVSPRNLDIREGAQAILVCNYQGFPPGTPFVWSRVGNELPMQSSVDRRGSTLTIPVAKVMDSGDYVCSVDGYQALSRLNVVRIGPEPEQPTGTCGRDEAVCRSGQCIRREYRCDGEKDCLDGSDEMDCFNGTICEPNEFQCPSGQCMMKIWRCDGEKDCTDGFDEQNCRTRGPDEPCDPDEFQCVSGDQCIPLAYQCDKEIDCQDRSDEIGCSAPVIIVPPVAEIEVEIGQTFTIICEAVGVPTPLIVWRLNWGNIRYEDRITTVSEQGRGTLTVRDARYEDAGAYTCEAINNRGSIFAIPDAIVIVRRIKGPCSEPLFNTGATSADQCLRCFCFGHTVKCFSSDLSISRISLVSPLQLVDRNSPQKVEQAFIEFLPSTREYQVQDVFKVLPAADYYWSLPREFLGERLTSYGGELKYTIYFEVDGRPSFIQGQPDVILMGNGITLYYRGRTVPSSGIATSISVPLTPDAWQKYEGPRRGDTPIAQYASREDLMMVLENLESVFIRGIYDNKQTITRIGGVLMTTAVDYPTDLGLAYLVEECTCPTGYTGLSCQDCAPGFNRVQRGEYLGECVSCSCNGHSNDCEAQTGRCRNCLHNTEGDRCERCMEGFYGDPRRGTSNDCQPCPCPLTSSSNQFSRTCSLDADNNVTCTNCPEGYTGRRCERCIDGYVGNPLILGSSCRRVPVEEYCDPRGSLSTRPDPVTRQCTCKANINGPLCDSCKPNSFYLSDQYPDGCINCFCMGVSRTCQSTTWNRATVSAAFTRDDQGITLTDMMGKAVEVQRFTIDRQNLELVFSDFPSLPRDTYFWSLPARFLGDKVSAYGGSLRFELRFRPRNNRSAVDRNEPLVKISGNDITLVHRTRTAIRPNQRTAFNVVFFEQNWYRVDGEVATREHLMMALADLDSILIRASFDREQQDGGLRDVGLDIAEDRVTGQDRAYPVEQCVCEVGYRGLSCEDCDTGYTRSGAGLYLGLCAPCVCNGHSSECDPETGVCRNCQHNTEGDSCEKCSAGYYGDAKRGTRSDCQKCPCPLTEAPNQFSPTCILASDGQTTCTACPAGHTGRRCESCLPGYTGNPLQRGDYCKVDQGSTCDCDRRGTVPNTQCDANTQQCQCKAYAQGRRCERCREGYFYLSEENEQGCLSCYCSGITNQCTSSSYYRDVIRPQFGSDGSHNFVLMNRRMNNIISEGFVVDATRNQITFNKFQGIQNERESLLFQLPAKFRGDKATSYGGYLRFTIEYRADQSQGSLFRDVDVELMSRDQQHRLYFLLNPSLQMNEVQSYEILLREDSFRDLSTNAAPTRETFMTVLSDLAAILIRATYHTRMASVTLRDVSMDIAVASPTTLGTTAMVESCRCPQGYTGLSCEKCAPGYLRVSDSGSSLGRCVRCNCNGHAASCDTETGKCLSCQHNTEGDRCERCVAGFYGDATAGTPNDCRSCPCPLSVPSNQFSRTCFLAEDGIVTCDRCPTGYTGRDCGTCASGYVGNPRELGGACRPQEEDQRPVVNVSPVRVEEPVGSTVIFRCSVTGQGPFNVVWSRLDSRPLPSDRASQSPRYELTLRELKREDNGRYVCTATNAYGVTRGHVDLTVVSGPSPIRVQVDRTRIEVEEGQTARIVCTAVGSLREATYILSWSKQGAAMPSRAIDQNGVLIIPNIQVSDAGNFVCTGSDMFSTGSVTATIIVTVSESAPSIRIEPRYQTVEEGSPVRFECIVTASPRAKVEWHRGDRPLSPEASVTQDGVFQLPRAQSSDEGDYFCKATNKVGTSDMRTILYVTKKETKPDITIIVRQTSVVALIGSTATLECHVEDETGRVTLFWSRTGGLPPGSVQTDGVLTIPDIQPSYAGNYVCTGTTDTGRTGSAVTRLDVEVKPATERPTVRVEPEKITVPMGTTGTLRCIVTGVPTPTVTWLKSRQELSTNHQIDGEILRITQATMEDRGIYVCRAENIAGSDQDWGIVEVERRMRPKIEMYPDGTQTISVGGSALFQCRVMDGDPPPKVTWSRVGGLQLTEHTQVMENGVIMFKGTTQQEQGSYICTATNDIGTTTATATLIVQGPPTILIQPSKTIYAIVGQRVRMECISQGVPTPTVYWISPSAPRRGDIPVPFDEFPREEGTAILDIINVAKEDTGYYTCVAENTGGRTEDRVQLIVEEGQRAEVKIAGPGTLSVVDGGSVELTCTASAILNPLIRWRRREGPLPPGHSLRGGILSIPRLTVEYGGEYICSTSSPEGNYQASVFIIVTVSPRLTVSPSRLVARAGENIILRCSPTGSGPFNIEWSKVNGVLSPRASENEGILEIQQVTAADAGRYRCVATSASGSSEGYAVVEITVPPTVRAAEREYSVQQNAVVELRCDFTGSPEPTVRWDHESGELPPQHRVQDGVLTIYNVQPKDSGRYICTATNAAGTARDYVFVTVSSGPVINGGEARIDTQIVNVGDRVEMECIVAGTPLPTIRWSRDDGPLPASAIRGDGILLIPDVRLEDAGTYTCTAINQAGSVQSKVVLYVRARPLISVPRNSMTAALGDSASIGCEASGYPSPQITWYRKNGQMPADYKIEGGSLKIPHVKTEDAGTYICSAQNQYGQTDASVDLKIGDLIPHFKQNPNSYIAYQPLSDVYLDFDLLLSLKPESTEGMVLYNGQTSSGAGDFVCFGLNEGYPEFRFDVGSGPAIIRGNNKLNMTQWHTVKLTRDRQKGTMVVNDEPAYTGVSPGNFQGLDLLENMYLGSVPDFNIVPRAAGFRTGFVGSVSEVKIKGISLNLGAEALKVVGIEQYDVCQYNPCLNGGICVPRNSKYGYECQCRQGFAGTRCETTGETCYPGACGPSGRCFTLSGTRGFRCVCPVGKTGAGCQVDVNIINPLFNRTSFISYPVVEDALFSLSIYIEFKPHSLEDAILLYDANSRDGTGDFMSLVIKDRYLEFRFDTGYGPAIIRSRKPVRINEWTRVSAFRRNREGSLKVNDEEPVVGISPGDTVGLNLKLPLYLGGVDQVIRVSSNAGTSQGFIGCVAQLRVNDKTIGLVRDALESANIQDCGESRICERQPCANGSTCEDLPGPDYRCLCPPTLTGVNCNIEINICLTQTPCKNQAPCSITPDGYRCDCPLGFMGKNCEAAVRLGTSIEVEGNGFIEFSKDLLPHTNTQERETISFDIKTTEPNGVIVWQAELSGKQLQGADYFAVGLKDGYLELSYELGSGPALLKSTVRVDDGYLHSIQVSRLGRSGTLVVDNNAPVKGDSQGFLQMLNTKGNIFIGGVALVKEMTGNKFTQNFNGCIENIRIQDKGPMRLPGDAISGYNVRPCVNK